MGRKAKLKCPTTKSDQTDKSKSKSKHKRNGAAVGKQKSKPEKNLQKNVRKLSRKKVLNDLVEAQGNPVQFRETCKNEAHIDFIIKTAAEAQASLIKTNTSKYFKEAHSLVKTLQEEGHDHKTCKHDVSLVLKTIAYAEDHPEPDDLGGIDLKVLYTTLAQLSMGYPTPELDGNTFLFLVECLNDLRIDLQSPIQEELLTAMQSQFEEKCPDQQSTSHLSTKLKHSLYSEALNPLGLSLPIVPPGDRNEVLGLEEECLDESVL